MTELEIVLSRLLGVKKTSNGYDTICPCHDDQHQSLSVSEKDGKLLLYCHAGCSFENIIKALDLRPDVNSSSSVIRATPIITDIYNYPDDDNMKYQVVRYQPKNFKQRRPDGKGGWLWNLNGIIPTLYRLSEVLKATKDGRQVFIVEGEKDVNNLRKNGQVATTISGGVSTKWHPSLIPLFQDARVIIIPDNDAPGLKYAEYVANLLYGWCSSLKLIILPVKDVSDYLETQTAGLITTIDKLLQIVDNTSEYIPTGAVTRDEFNDWRGINQYLWQLLLKQKAKENILF